MTKRSFEPGAERGHRLAVGLAAVIVAGGLVGCGPAGGDLSAPAASERTGAGIDEFDPTEPRDHHVEGRRVVDPDSADRALFDDGVARLEFDGEVRQVGISFEADSVDGMARRVRRDGTWSTWSEWAPYFSLKGLHNAHVTFAEPVEAMEWRLAGGVESARIEWSDDISARDEIVGRSVRTEPAPEPPAGDVDRIRQQAVAPDDLVTSRQEWGAIDPDKICNDVVEPWRMTLHHTYDPADDGDDPAARMRQMQSYHVNSRGWCDIGYHFVVAQSGEIFQGRSRSDRPGAHAGGENDGNVGISMIGDYTSTEPPAVQVDSFVDIADWARREHDIGLSTEVFKGHRQWPGQNTQCPGDVGLSYVDEILARLQERAADDGEETNGGEDPGDDNGSEDENANDAEGENGGEEDTSGGLEDEDESPGLKQNARNVDVNTGFGDGCRAAGDGGGRSAICLAVLLVVGGVAIRRRGRSVGGRKKGIDAG